jgi:CheY-like chemotaxis protein
MEDKKIFMIVDDDSDDSDFFCEAISEIDIAITCITANNGEDALTKLRKAIILPDLLFLDLNMPRMDGRQCLTELKKDSKLKDIPVIIFTTSSSQKDIDDTLKLGASYFLTKPSDFHSLHSKIQFAVERIGQDFHSF